jgi:hypothetical protein
VLPSLPKGEAPTIQQTTISLVQYAKVRPTLSIDKKVANQQIVTLLIITQSQQTVRVEEESIVTRLRVGRVKNTKNTQLHPFNNQFIPLCLLNMKILLSMGAWYEWLNQKAIGEYPL